MSLPQLQLPRAIGTDAVGGAPPTAEARRIAQPRQQTNDLHHKHHNRNRVPHLLPTNRMANLAHEGQTRKAEDLDDEEDVATVLDEASKDIMGSKMRKRSNIRLAPCGLEALELI
jgi:hypothetical protein